MLKKQTPVPTPRKDEFKNTTGVFEGGGYLEKGIYSSFYGLPHEKQQCRKILPGLHKSD